MGNDTCLAADLSNLGNYWVNELAGNGGYKVRRDAIHLAIQVITFISYNYSIAESITIALLFQHSGNGSNDD